MITDRTVIFKPETLLDPQRSGIKHSVTSILSFQTNRLRYNKVQCLEADNRLIQIRNKEYNFNYDGNNLLYLQAVLENPSLKMCAFLKKLLQFRIRLIQRIPVTCVMLKSGQIISGSLRFYNLWIRLLQQDTKPQTRTALVEKDHDRILITNFKVEFLATPTVFKKEMITQALCNR